MILNTLAIQLYDGTKEQKNSIRPILPSSNSTYKTINKEETTYVQFAQESHGAVFAELLQVMLKMGQGHELVDCFEETQRKDSDTRFCNKCLKCMWRKLKVFSKYE